MALDNTISTPLFQQLADVLRNAIENGEYPAGSRLPTENDLCQRYSVSRVTVRKALDELSQGEYLVRKPGKGTFVSGKKFRRNLSGVLGYSEMCHRMGYEPGARTIHIGLEEPDEDDSVQLHLARDEQILVIERLRLADGEPVMLEVNKFPEKKFFFLFNEDLNNASLYETIRKKTGVIFTQSAKLLEIVFANYQESRYLGVAKGHPLLSIKSSVQDDSGENRHLSHQLCIADKFKLMV